MDETNFYINWCEHLLLKYVISAPYIKPVVCCRDDMDMFVTLKLGWIQNNNNHVQFKITNTQYKLEAHLIIPAQFGITEVQFWREKKFCSQGPMLNFNPLTSNFKLN